MLSGARRYVTWRDPDNAILLNTILWTHTHIALQVAPLPKLHQKTITAIYCGKEDGQDKTLPRKSQNHNWRNRISSPPTFSSILFFFLRKISSGFALWIQIRNFQSPEMYSDQNWRLLRFHDDRPPLSFKSDRSFNFPPLYNGRDWKWYPTLNLSQLIHEFVFTNHQFPNNCAHCNVSRWCH